MSYTDSIVEVLKEAFETEMPIALALTEAAASSPQDLDHFLRHIAVRMCVGYPHDFCVISHSNLMELRVKSGYYEDLSNGAIQAVREICVAMDANAAFVDDAVAQAINIAYNRGKAGEPLQAPPAEVTAVQS